MYKVRLEDVNSSNRTAFVNLFNLYHHDLAGFVPDMYPNVDEDGYYDKTAAVKILELSGKEVRPYIIRYMGKIAGIMLFSFPPFVKHGTDYCIQDIFVLKNYRGMGIASEACRIIFNKFHGRYCVQVLNNNIPALRYWDNLIASKGRLISREKNNELLIEYEFEIVNNLTEGERN